MADLDGARELGLSQFAIVGGALMAALAIDRTDPLVTGITKARLITRRMRWAAALLGSAAVLGVGSYLRGEILLRGDEPTALAPLGLAFQTLTLLLASLGLFAGLGALVVAFGSNARRTATVLGIGAVSILAGLAGMFVMPVLGILGVPIILAALIVAASGERALTADYPVPAWRRAAIAVPFAVLTLAIIAVGVLHITVWNPLAKVPGMTLDEIYAAMAEANEAPLAGLIVAWAVFWGLAAIMLPILASVPRLSAFFTARRIVVTGLLLAGTTVGFQFFAGFNMGMSLADTFMTTGGDRAMSGSVIATIGQFALVAALIIGLSPRPLKAELAHLTVDA